MNERHRFGMFAKFWAPGKVKTRLAQSVGVEKAAAVYLSFLRTQCKRFAAPGFAIAFAPDDKEAEFRGLLAEGLEGTELLPQGSGDLGTRMYRFFEASFREGFDRVALIGSDTPTLPTDYVRQAFKALNHDDVVLGPTDDGGYYLVGAKKHVPPIFTDISWSTESVWDQTVSRLKEHGVSFGELPKWYDVDDVMDLTRLMSELRGGGEHAQLRVELEQILGNDFE